MVVRQRLRKNAFAHESGIHQDGMLKNTQTYEIMRPEDVGVSDSNLVMGKHSGRHAFRDKLASHGYELDPDALNDAFRCFKALADAKKQVFDDDLVAIVDEQLSAEGERILLKRLHIVAGTDGPQTANIEVEIDGASHTAEASGNGPVDAVFRAIRAVAPHDGKLDLYQVHTVTDDTDAQADVSVRLNGEGIMAVGRSHDVDTLVASAQAYIHALNKLEARRRKRMAA